MNILKSIIDNQGELSQEDVQTLAQEFPNMPVVIKWEKSMRTKHLAKDVEDVMITNANANNYAREVFIACGTIDEINQTIAKWF